MSSNDKRDEQDMQSGETEPQDTSAVDQTASGPDTPDPSENPSDKTDDAETLETAEGTDAADTKPEDARAEPEPVEPEPVAAAPAPAEKKGGSGFVPGLFGGIVAAGVGFGAAQFIDVDWLSIRGGDDPVTNALTSQKDAIESQAASIAALESQLANTVSDFNSQVSQLSTAVANPDLSSMEQTVTGLSDQVKTEIGSLSSGVLAQLGQVTDTLSNLSGAVNTLETRLEGVDSSLSDLDSGLTNVTDGLGTVGSQLGAVDERLVAVEKRPLVESSDTAKATFQAYEREVQRLTEALESQKSESEETAKRMAELASLTEQQISAVQEEAAARLASMQSEAQQQIEATRAQTQSDLEATKAETADQLQEAQTTVQQAAITNALLDLEKALEEGTSYSSSLDVLNDSHDVPDALTANADAGVQSHASLADSYPEAARGALDASHKSDSTEQDAVGKISAFFKAQTGARSLAPKDGDDADSVLSRAEAALKGGDLSAALTELDRLSEAGKAAMSGWIDAAQARVAALEAAAGLTASQQTN